MLWWCFSDVLVMLWCSYGDDLKCLGDILVMCWCCFGDALARLGPCILKFFRVFCLERACWG